MKAKTNIAENKFADVPIRVKTWGYIILVFSLAVPYALGMKLFISFIGFQVFFEVLRMFKIYVRLWSEALVLSILIFSSLHSFSYQYFWYSSFSVLLLVVIYFLCQKVSKKQLLGVLFGVVLSCIIFPHLYHIRVGTSGLKSLLFLVVVTSFNDVFQYLMGKLYGKYKVIPKVSPNKTWEGLILGVILTILLSNILGYYLLSFNVFENTFFGLIFGFFGFFGDVLISYIKRKTAVKDTGKLLPGHGGLLDRMDSLIFNAPVFYYLLPLFLKG